MSDESVHSIPKQTQPETVPDSIYDPCNRLESIPDDLKNVLSKFALEYLTLRPSKMADFGLQFFANMQDRPLEMTRRSRTMADISLLVCHSDNCSVRDSSKSSEFPSNDVDKYYKTDTQSAHLYVALKRDFFRNHNDDGVFNAINQMYSISIEAGESVQLRDDSSLYVIEDGTLNIIVDDSHEPIDENFGTFNLTNLKLRFRQNELSINCENDTVMWVLDGPAFQRCWIGDVHVTCRDYESILEFSPIFGCLVDAERQMIADLMTTKRFEAEQVIYDNTKCDYEVAGYYFIQEGLVSLAVNDGEGGLQNVLLKSGQQFGEINAKDAMILKKATAVTKVRCTYLDASAITERIRHPFSQTHPNLCSKCKCEF